LNDLNGLIDVHNMTKKELVLMVQQLQHTVGLFEQKEGDNRIGVDKRFFVRGGEEASNRQALIVNRRLIENKKIEQIWERIRVSDAYLSKWQNSDTIVSEVEGICGTFENKDYPRIPILLDFKEWIVKHNLSSPNRLLATDPGDCELKVLTPKHVIPYVYNSSTDENDLHLLGREASFNESGFDLVIISQTFEHVYDPLLVASNVFNVLKPGGYLFTSAPAVSAQHMTPYHFFHYTPMGFAMLFELAGMTVVELGQWGNFNYESHLLGQQLWPDYRELRRRARNNIIVNTRTNPDQVWVLCRKPL